MYFSYSFNFFLAVALDSLITIGFSILLAIGVYKVEYQCHMSLLRFF